MKYLVMWSIQGNSMSDPSQHVERLIAASDLLDLNDKLQDRQTYHGYWGDPSEIYEVSNRLTFTDFTGQVMKLLQEKVKGLK